MATAIFNAILDIHGDDPDGWHHLPIEAADIPDHTLDRIRGDYRYGRSAVARTPRTIATLGDLAGMTDAELLRIDNLGRVTLRRIREQLNLQRETWLRLAAERRGAGSGQATAASSVQTLRDQFAMQALHGIIDNCGLSAKEMAERCYEVADAMVKARLPIPLTPTR